MMIWAHRGASTSIITVAGSQDYFALSPRVSKRMLRRPLIEFSLAPPHLGRLLTPDDDKTRLGHPVAVLQYDFWQKRFAGAREIVGSSIRLNGSPFTVIGVSAPGFEGTDVGLQTQVWTPVTMKPVITPTWDALDDERYAWFYLFGRLKPGVGIEEAQAAMRVLYRQRQEEELQGQFFQRFPETREQFLRQSFSLIPAARGQSNLRSTFERPLVVLQWLVGFVLLIACTNVANLLLARGATRGSGTGLMTSPQPALELISSRPGAKLSRREFNDK